MSAARLVQLYPEELGVAGDRGNVLALVARLAAVGIETEVVEHRRGDTMPDVVDVVVIGNGPLSAMRNILDDLRSHAERLVGWARSGVPVFAYGSGAELLGRRIDLVDGTSIDGLGVFPFRTERVHRRTVGYVIVDSDAGRLVGFEDNASRWILDDSATPLGRVVTGDGNGDGSEGVVSEASVATQIGGPALPLNPVLTEVLVRAVAERLGAPSTVHHAASDLDDYARRAREVIVANASHVFSRI